MVLPHIANDHSAAGLLPRAACTPITIKMFKGAVRQDCNCLKTGFWLYNTWVLNENKKEEDQAFSSRWNWLYIPPPLPPPTAS